jgi:hypothetical protein
MSSECTLYLKRFIKKNKTIDFEWNRSIELFNPRYHDSSLPARVTSRG